MSRKKYEEKKWILKRQLELGEITEGEYQEKELELYKYWLAFGKEDNED